MCGTTKLLIQLMSLKSHCRVFDVYVGVVAVAASDALTQVLLLLTTIVFCVTCSMYVIVVAHCWYYCYRLLLSYQTLAFVWFGRFEKNNPIAYRRNEVNNMSMQHFIVLDTIMSGTKFITTPFMKPPRK